jgi:hypothetical protein
MTKPKHPTPAEPEDKEQYERFIETARQVGADRESTAAGDDVMGRLAKQPPEPRKPLERRQTRKA